jgi:hypothetical protein
LTVAQDRKSRHVIEGLPRIDGVHHIPESQFSLGHDHRFVQARFQLQVRAHAGEPTADHRGQTWVTRLEFVHGQPTVIDHVPKDPRGGHQHGTFTGIDECIVTILTGVK